MTTRKPLRAKLATSVSKGAAALSRATGRGDGSVIGGRLGLIIDPDLLAHLANGRQIALISGTNGKTTTTRLTTAAVGVLGPVATNSYGANMPTGHTSALARAGDTPFAVLEVDEHYLPQVLNATSPQVVALLNLSRDQLDRAREVAMMAQLWRDTLRGRPVHLVANADDPMVVWAAADAARVTWVAAGQRWHDDSWVCPECGGAIARADPTVAEATAASPAPTPDAGATPATGAVQPVPQADPGRPALAHADAITPSALTAATMQNPTLRPGGAGQPAATQPDPIPPAPAPAELRNNPAPPATVHADATRSDPIAPLTGEAATLQPDGASTAATADRAAGTTAVVTDPRAGGAVVGTGGTAGTMGVPGGPGAAPAARPDADLTTQPAIVSGGGAPDADWHCTNCSLRRPTPSWSIDGTAVVDPRGVRHEVTLQLPGRVNRANAATALAVAAEFGVPPAEALPRLAEVASVAGRYAQVQRDGKAIRLLLAKNPAGWLEAFDMAEPAPTLLSINARDPDGMDTSWLFDVDFSPLLGRPVLISGDRAYDLAVRLEVNGITFTHVRSFAEALAATPPGRLEVIANYSAFQDIRAELDRVN